MSTAFIYSDQFGSFDYGGSHPLRPFRLKLTYELMKSCGLLGVPGAEIIEALPATDDELRTFHDSEYLDVLKAAGSGRYRPFGDRFGIGTGDNPPFRGLYEWSQLVAGASLQAASIVSEGKASIAFNISGGLHHAKASQASGFCYVNDVVIAILHLLQTANRIAYIDIDAHHGDGVQEAFYNSDRVLTISLHQTGETLFPGTGFTDETGEGKGSGYSVNVPMPPGADDALFLHAFDEVVPPLLSAYRPDFVVTQLGVDMLAGDPLAHLYYTMDGFCEIVRRIKTLAPRWIALGGGGYDITNVAKAWTLAWAIMNDVEPPEEIPEDFLDRYRTAGFRSNRMRDLAIVPPRPSSPKLRHEVDRTLDEVSKRIFPRFGL